MTRRWSAVMLLTIGLATAAAAEQQSQHPLAQAVVTAAQDRGLTPDLIADSLTIVPGAGVRAQSRRGTIEVGNERLFAGSSLVDDALRCSLESRRQEGQTPLLVGLDGKLLGTIFVADPVAPHSADAIAELAAAIAPLSIEELRRELVAVREMLGRPARDPL